MGKTIPSSPVPSTAARLGLHYYPDTLHYREADLQTWLPALQDLGAAWLVLHSELDRAIPEQFLRGLKQAGIEPLIQFQLSLEGLPDLKALGTLLDVYARWGARYVIFYDQPNVSAAWPLTGWVQQDLVERFLDRYLPAANLALQVGLTPVFPPLRPGGSYWDTAFLRSALQAIQRRKQDALLQNLVLSAYAWTGERSLDWGAGGPERWPQSRPYLTAPESQDQMGFRIFDWYEAIARSVLHRDFPILLLQAGLGGNPHGTARAPECAGADPEVSLNIARLLAGEQVADPQCADLLAADQTDESRFLEPIPSYVIGCNFWLLSADPSDPNYAHAWFTGNGQRSPAAEKIHVWRRKRQSQGFRDGEKGAFAAKSSAPESAHPIRHYLLLPGYEWGVSDWYLEVIRPFVKKNRPTVGFSLEEAVQAARVTVVGNAQNFPEDYLDRLQKAGCWIEQISGDGTNIATELAER